MSFIITVWNIIALRMEETGLDRSRGFQEVKVPRLRDKGTG